MLQRVNSTTAPKLVGAVLDLLDTDCLPPGAGETGVVSKGHKTSKQLKINCVAFAVNAIISGEVCFLILFSWYIFHVEHKRQQPMRTACGKHFSTEDVAGARWSADVEEISWSIVMGR